MLKLGIDRLSLFDTVPARASDLAAKLAKDFGDGRIAAVHDLPPAMAQADGLVHATPTGTRERSEEHTSELQSQSNLVCRLLLEKKKKRPSTAHIPKPATGCSMSIPSCSDNILLNSSILAPQSNR